MGLGQSACSCCSQMRYLSAVDWSAVVRTLELGLGLGLGLGLRLGLYKRCVAEGMATMGALSPVVLGPLHPCIFDVLGCSQP